jgi:hypothetical protein
LVVWAILLLLFLLLLVAVVLLFLLPLQVSLLFTSREQ